jgi:site-specific DNA recombinase
MDKVIIYARVSSKEQEAEGYSIPAQLKALHEYASKHNYLIVEEFKDIETAKKAGRTQFNKMLVFVKENSAIKHILVEKTDRLLRNLSDYALLDHLIIGSNLTIHLVKENDILSKNSRSGEKLMFGIKTLLAKNHIDNLAEEVSKGMTEKAAQGGYPSGAPYGYVNVREHGKSLIRIDPQTAPFVKKMFELYATGSYSLLSLRKKMLADGMVYKNGKNFFTSKVEKILKNEFYTGVFYWKAKRYDNAYHEPIVSRELFQQVQTILRRPYKSKSRKGLFPYSNLFSCGVCGCALTAEVKKEKYIYYHCTGYKGNCKQPYLKQEVLEQHFESLLGTIRITDDVQEIILHGLRDSMKDKIAYHNDLIQQLEKQIHTLQRRIDQAYLDKLDGIITEDFWKTHSRKWLEEKELLTIKLLATQRADTHYLESANIILELAKRAVELFQSRPAEQKRRMIDLLVSNCSYKDEKLDIELKPVFNEILKTTKTGDWYTRTFSKGHRGLLQSTASRGYVCYFIEEEHA